MERGGARWGWAVSRLSLAVVVLGAVRAWPALAGNDAPASPEKSATSEEARSSVDTQKVWATSTDNLLAEMAQKLGDDSLKDSASAANTLAAEDAQSASEPPKAKDEANSPEDAPAPLTPPEEEVPLGQPLNLDKVKLDLLYRLADTKAPRTELRISLDECVRMALENNQDILVISYEPLKADGDLLSAKGEFDPAVSAMTSYTRYWIDPRATSTSLDTSSETYSSNFSDLNLRGLNSSVSSAISGGGGAGTWLQSRFGSSNPGVLEQLLTDTLNEAWTGFVGPGPQPEAIKTFYKSYKLQFGGKTQWGTQYAAQFEMRDQASIVDITDGWYNDSLVFLARAMMWAQNQDVGAWPRMLRKDEVSGGFTFSLSQPLLRGRGKVNVAKIRLAENARKAANLQTEQQVMKVLGDVLKAYWDLVGAVDAVRVRRESLSNAERLLDISQRRLDIGTGAAIEVLQAKAGVAMRQSEVIAAMSQLEDAEDRLKSLVGMCDEDHFFPMRLIPTDRPNIKDVELNEKVSTARALENRPEILLAELDIESAGVDKERAANNMLPQVDLQGSTFTGGRGTGRNDVFRGARDRNENSYSVAIQGSMPLRNRAARGAYNRAVMTERQAEQRRTKTVQELMLGVRLALRAVETSRVLVESNAQARALQETNVEAEEKRLQFGVTTSYNVLQQQEDLTKAQVQELQAQIAFEKALVDLQLIEGAILRDYGIEFEAPEPVPPVTWSRSIVSPAPEIAGEKTSAPSEKKESAPAP